MKKNGVNMGLCGVRGVRLRPMLIFNETHSEFELDPNVLDVLLIR